MSVKAQGISTPSTYVPKKPTLVVRLRSVRLVALIYTIQEVTHVHILAALELAKSNVAKFKKAKCM